MGKRILIVQGHPDAGQSHYGHALAEAYANGASEAGHELRRIEVAKLDFPLLRSAQDWQQGEPVPAIREAQQALAWAEHLVILYPLWLGSMPALLKGFLEQVARPGFAVAAPGEAQGWQKKLKGRSARLVVTMGMPALMYRWYYRAHSLKNLERNILGFVGISPVRASLIGLVEGNAGRRQRWLARLRKLGREAS
ncbi:MAG: flavodoxin family protein [Nevskiaceae bacterium]|nr:MAG: flavodoxin family protein [Nevskiaceae bacterium]TAM26687.1 MAG: flavodoxin family protein [Nevskiaceae bacterium]